ncbi:thioredoxin domain-containing protein [Candidatus Falkowbacteria bacterium]|nr:thioredoxin domain-containing protein [Candidatus Falkowbacteria bacterium]
MFKQNKIYFIAAIILILAGLILITKEGKAPEDSGGQVLKSIDQTDHILGEVSAPVKIIIYSDFECPFCPKFAAAIREVESYFKDKVVIAFRHYFLPNHPNALGAAEAAECASEQGKFWEMHDKLFADNDAGRLGFEQFKIDAVDLNLNKEQFNQCLASGKYENKINGQKLEGAKSGVTGTPTIFLNNNIYPGAYPFEDFTSPDGRQNKGMKNIINEILNEPSLSKG